MDTPGPLHFSMTHKLLEPIILLSLSWSPNLPTNLTTHSFPEEYPFLLSDSICLFVCFLILTDQECRRKLSKQSLPEHYVSARWDGSLTPRTLKRLVPLHMKYFLSIDYEDAHSFIIICLFIYLFIYSLVMLIQL